MVVVKVVNLLKAKDLKINLFLNTRDRVVNSINPLWKVRVTRLHKIKDLSLILAMFFLPLGYDVLLYKLTQITGDYWSAVRVFYCVSGLFWLVYFCLGKVIRKLEKGE